MSSTESPVSRSFAMVAKISRVINGARPRLGSSSSSNFGFAINARPTASICRSPPERVPASCGWRSCNRGNSANTSPSVFINAARDSPERRLENPPSSRFSSTVISWNSSRFSGTNVIPRRTSASVSQRSTRSPAKRIVPREGSSPMIAPSSVVLPAPFGPITVAIFPVGTDSDTPRTAST